MTGKRRGTRPGEAPGVKPEAVLRVRMLGGFSVSVGSRTVEEDGWRLRKAASLVKLLALEPGHRMHRERLMDLLWPELEEGAQANNLRQALYVTRRSLESDPATAPRYLSLRGEQLALYPEGPLWVDVEAFEEAASAARCVREPAACEAALELYAGDLLPGDPYEAWAEERREELRKTYLSLLLELAGIRQERREHEAAIEALGRALVEEPAHEGARVGLMHLFALCGRRAEALKQYELLEEILSRELAAEPSTPARCLREEILSGAFPPARTPPSEGLPAEEPPGSPSRRAERRRHNLPEARSSFVGREREMVEVKRALSMTRLLTLAGAGGSGKTRLAVEVARNLAGAYPDGAWLVELAPLSDPELAPQAVAAALKVREQPGRPPITATLANHLRPRRSLLVLDNCEHVIDAATSLIDELLSSCPGLRVLATSREALRTPGEVVWQVPSLSVPEDSEVAASVEGLGTSEAARLFVERARSRDPSFELTEQNARAVAEVCRRLDGIPLAIELAATKVAVLSVEQISRRLDDALGLLRGGGRTAARRHQTLGGTLAWSYQLLLEAEKQLFGRLSVFAGGWSLEAAEAVGAEPGEDVLELLELLVDKSLIVVADGEEDRRHRLLEPVRQYARERLEESGEAGDARRRHALWCLRLAEEAEEGLIGPDHQRWLERLETEHDNLRAALRWSLNGGEAELGLRLAAALWLFWYTHGHLAEGRGWLERTLAATAQP